MSRVIRLCANDDGSQAAGMKGIWSTFRCKNVLIPKGSTDIFSKVTLTCGKHYTQLVDVQYDRQGSSFVAAMTVDSNLSPLHSSAICHVTLDALQKAFQSDFLVFLPLALSKQYHLTEPQRRVDKGRQQ